MGVFSVLFALLLFFSITDILYRRAPNLIVLPAIIIALIYTKFYIQAVTMVIILAPIIANNITEEECRNETIDKILNYIKGTKEAVVTCLSLWIKKLSKFCKIKGGGDLKVFVLIAALKGWLVIPIFLMTVILIYMYRLVFNEVRSLPACVFIFISFIAIQSTTIFFAIMAGKTVLQIGG